MGCWRVDEGGVNAFESLWDLNQGLEWEGMKRFRPNSDCVFCSSYFGASKEVKKKEKGKRKSTKEIKEKEATPPGAAGAPSDLQSRRVAFTYFPQFTDVTYSGSLNRRGHGD